VRVAKLPKHAVTLAAIVRAKEGQELLLEAELRALVAPTRREEAPANTICTARRI